MSSHDSGTSSTRVTTSGSRIETQPTPTPRDDLVRITGAPAAIVYAALTELALANRAELLPGGLAVKG